MPRETKKICVTLVIMVRDQTRPISEESPYRPKYTQVRTERATWEIFPDLELHKYSGYFLLPKWIVSVQRLKKVGDSSSAGDFWATGKIRISVVKSRQVFGVYKSVSGLRESAWQPRGDDFSET